MEPKASLTVLTFIGLTVGFVGGLISQLAKTSVDVDGTTQKRLTSLGKLALAISLVGFAGSFASELLKSSIAAQQDRDSQNAKKEEAKWKARSSELAAEILRNTRSALEDSLKTRFEIAESRQKVLSDNLVRETRLYGKLSAANTPLTSLTIKLFLEHVPAQIIDHVRKGIRIANSSPEDSDVYRDLDEHHNVGDEDSQILIRSEMDKKVIQPFINLLARDQFLNAQGMLVFSLDSRFSAIAGVGWVNIAREDGKRVLPSGVVIGGQNEWCPSVYCYQPVEKNRPQVSIDIVRDSLVLSVKIGLTSLDDGLLRYSRNTATLSALSDDIEFLSWSPSDGKVRETETISVLPFDAAEVNPNILAVESRNRQTWIDQKPMWMRHMLLQIIPNGVERISKMYYLTLSAGGNPEDLEGEDVFGYVRIWHGHAR